MTEKEKIRKFKVNDYLTLKLDENGKTIIFVAGNMFQQCKYLLIDIPIDKISDLDEVESIDEAAEKLDKSLEPLTKPEQLRYNIPPSVEFWGHCSNLQVWYENNYNTRLLHRNLAFPLLKKLTEAGDSVAKKVFKEEIAKRLSSGEKSTIDFLIQEGYSGYLEYDDFLFSILDFKEAIVIKNFEQIFETKIDFIYEREAENQPGFEVLNKHVGYLSLNGRNINMIPEEIGNLSHLEYIDLSYNEIERLPDSFRKLKRLRFLNLDKNKIKRLPETIKEFKHLEFFSLVDNLLEDLPDSIGELINLRELTLALNNLVSLPESLSNLKNLKSLHLGSNYIEKLPNSIGKLTSLESLNLEYNKLKYLPDSIGNLYNLRYLYLEHNNLAKIPNTMGKLKSLEYMHLNDNKISSLPKSLGKLENFKFLNLKNNKIEKKEVPREILRGGLSIYV